MRLAIARRYADGVMENAGPRVDAAARDASGRRLRIGYLSADLHEHPTSQLLVGALEHHDRARYEVHAYALDSDDGTAHRARLVAAFEHFHDVRALAHDALARQIAADGIDVLVDLQGYTAESRPQVAALRPAPVQVNYLGYPGTMGAAFVDFILADATLVPPGDEQWYGETVIRLPDTYQANDDRQAIAERAFARSELGLPEDGAVFASFNAHFKIERETFAAWMRILAAVPGSVLWLLGGPGEAALRAAADRSGIEPARIVFATRMRKPEHLARHRAADLFLDTYTYNAHTTASDALWAGLPVLTRPADGFAGRVAASLLRAIGLPELVAPDLDAYERTAVELARDPAALAALRAKLAAHRSSLPLFDTARFTRNLEAAFDEMWARKAR
jgi:predicted O-linked N-acetylglucosamine transferase (SPINDLY family)